MSGKTSTRLMMECPSMEPGEIYLGRFPFGDIAGMKLRPVLVLSRPVGSAHEVLVAYISSVIPTESLPTDMFLDPSTERDRGTNLKSCSSLRLHKLATLHGTSLVRRLGVLSPEAAGLVAAKLRAWLSL
ncbi:MAG: type II toxin-antitoxin system PemK/MazF family toxin [Planctomycetia bacterium]